MRNPPRLPFGYHLRVFTALTALTAPVIGQRDAAPTANWPQFLGADQARGRGATSLTFDRERDLRYRVELPPGESSPCIWGDQIFLTGHDGDELVMFALDKRTGKQQWRFGVPAPEGVEFAHKDAAHTMSTACTNGRRVFFYIASYGLVARELDGELAWEKRLPAPKADFGIGSSPIVHGDHVILVRDGCPDAALYALDEATGKEVWSVPRLRYSDTHSTPFVWQNRDRTELVIASTGTVAGLDPESGKEHWRVEGLTPLVCTTPTASADLLYFAGWSTPGAAGINRLTDGMEDPVEFTPEELADPALIFKRFDADGDGSLTISEAPAGRVRQAYAFFDRNKNGTLELEEWMPVFQFPVTGKNVLIAIRPGGEGDVSESHVAWQVARGIPYVSSPLLYDGRLYLVKAGGILSCFDPVTGKPKFRRTRLSDRSEYYATPVGVDGHVLVAASAGTLFVLKASDELVIERTVEFGEPLFATPAVSDGVVYVRTRAALYAFGRAD